MSETTLTFLGATETVTGSRFLISTSKSKVLVDCGMFQGTKEIRRKNWEPFPVDLNTLDGVILTHAHLDHSGYLPLLVRDGYKKSIHSTQYTKGIASIILRDSAHLQELDAKFAAEIKYSEHPEPKPLYDSQDVEKALKQFETHQFHTLVKVTEDISFTFYHSGHILGSSFLLVHAGDKNILFTSDLGRANHPLLVTPDLPPKEKIDIVVTESTYGNRIHDTSEDIFANEINKALKKDGKILIPAFAVDRTEVILMALHKLIDQKKIPQIPIYVDSPMAIKALELYREAVANNSSEIREGISQEYANLDPFNAGALKQMVTTQESKDLKDIAGRGILIAASGMSSGGRVVHHLKNLLPDSNNTVILVGFQAAGTRGRQLEEGNSQVKIHGNWVPVKANIVKIESFSVHADSDELVAWLSHIDKPSKTFIVHGEADSQLAMKNRLSDQLGWATTIPKSHKIYDL